MNTISRGVLGAALIGLLGACGKGNTTAGAPVADQVPRTGTATATATPNPATPNPATPNPPGVPPCSGAGVEAVIAPGDAPSAEIWHSAVVVTNRGSTPCTLQGVSKIEFYTGGDGRPLGIKEVTSDGVPQDLVSIKPGEQATMVLVVPTTVAEPVPADCLEGAAFAGVTLPGDTTSIEAWLSDRALEIPPVCGAVHVGPWGKGGAPGVN